MHSVQSCKKQLKLRSRQRRRRITTAAAAATCNQATTATLKASTYYTTFSDKSVPKAATIVHGIVVSNLSLVLLQKEYIEQFYFEKRSGGGGPDEDPDINELIFGPAAVAVCKSGPQMPDLRYG